MADACRWVVTRGPRGFKGKTFRTFALARAAAKVRVREGGPPVIRLEKQCASHEFPVAAREVVLRKYKRAPKQRVLVRKVFL